MGNINFDIDKFNDLAVRYGGFVQGENDDAVITGTAFSLDGKVREFKVSTKDYKGKLFRSDEMIRDNNRIRNSFKREIVSIFGSVDDIPVSVRKAMNFDTDFDNAGRPLSTRRIKATLNELKSIANIVNTLNNHIQTECKVLRIATLSDKMVNDAAEYAEQCAAEVKKMAEKHLLPGIRKNGKISQAACEAFLRETAVNVKSIKLSIDKSSSDYEKSADFAKFCDSLREAYLIKGLTRNLDIAHHFMTKDYGNLITKVLSRLSDQFGSECTLTATGKDEDLEKHELAETRDNLRASMGRMLPRLRSHYLLALPDKEVVQEVDRIIARGYSIKDINLNDLFAFFYGDPSPQINRLRDVVMTHVAQRLLDGTMPEKNHTGKGGLDSVRMAIENDFVKYVKQKRSDLQLNRQIGREVYSMPDMFKNDAVYALLQAKTKAYLSAGGITTGGVEFDRKFIIGPNDMPAALKEHPEVIRTLLNHPDFEKNAPEFDFGKDDPPVKFVSRMSDIAQIVRKVITKSAPPGFKENNQLMTDLFATALKCYMAKNPKMRNKLKSEFSAGSSAAQKMDDLSSDIYKQQKELAKKAQVAYDKIAAKHGIKTAADIEKANFGHVYVDKNDELTIVEDGDQHPNDCKQIHEGLLLNKLNEKIKDATRMTMILDPGGQLRGYMNAIAQEIAKLK